MSYFNRSLFSTLLLLAGLMTACSIGDDSEQQLVNDSADLNAVLEQGALRGACVRYEQKGSNATEYEKQLCGKEMFFYEDFDTPGVPKIIVAQLIKQLPNSVGKGMSKFGMIADPFDQSNMPIGLGDALPIGNHADVPTVAFTCASCHFSQAPDGRYIVGLGNRHYDYGKQLVAIAKFPPFSNTDLSKESAAVQVAMQPLLEEWNAKPGPEQMQAFQEFLAGVAGLSVDPASAMSVEHAQAHASWGPGRLDALMFPNQVNDRVHSPTKIPNAFGLPKPDEMAAASPTNSPHLRIGWSGNAASIEEFAGSFIALGDGDPAQWVPKKIAPLVAFLESLKAPKSPYLSETEALARGQQLFTEKGCHSCHNGPGRVGTEIFYSAELGTDPAHSDVLDAAHTGVPFPNLTPANPTELTHGIKPPRLYAQWAAGRFLHNGSVASLEDLLCVGMTRPTRQDVPFSDSGHLFGCDASALDKADLIAYLKSL